MIIFFFILIKYNKLILFIYLFSNKLNVKEAIDYIAEAWNNVTPMTIHNCWMKTGILSSDNEFVDDDIRE